MSLFDEKRDSVSSLQAESERAKRETSSETALSERLLGRRESEGRVGCYTRVRYIMIGGSGQRLQRFQTYSFNIKIVSKCWGRLA